ncbi:hypothetical protein [Flavobacterium sp. 5]|nr:hypothetical protein [Flavobacterium sp. 5]PKB15737.1 hypothetical protein CLU82_0826 [Flavobacterium sp. 5]
MFLLAQMGVASCVPGVRADRYNGQLELAPYLALYTEDLSNS